MVVVATFISQLRLISNKIARAMRRAPLDAAWAFNMLESLSTVPKRDTHTNLNRKGGKQQATRRALLDGQCDSPTMTRATPIAVTDRIDDGSLTFASDAPR